MAINESSQGWFPRAVAIGAWLLLVGLIVQFPAHAFSVGQSACVLLAVALCSAISLMQFDVKQADVPAETSPWQYILVSVSFIIPLIWALQFALHAPLLTLPMFFLVGIFPQAVVLLRNPAGWTITEVPAPSFQADELSNDERPEGIRTFLQVVHDDSQDDVEEPEVESTLRENVTQWLQRSISDDVELIEGHVRVDFVEGQREAVVHISFCPPFEEMPEVVAEDLGSNDLEIRVAAIFKFGVRLMVRRPPNLGSRHSLAMNSYRVGFAAEAASSHDAA